MARDDYYVIEEKFLVFLYRKLKGSTAKDAEEYLQPHTKDFPISEEYFRFVVGSLAEEGYISGYKIVKARGGEVIELNAMGDISITRKGIGYLRDSGMI